MASSIRHAFLVTCTCAASVAQGQALTTLSVAGRSSDNVSVAAQQGFVALAWSASTSTATDIYVATSRDAGATFTAPVRVNATEGDARVSGEQPPRVALLLSAGATPAIVVVWTARGATGTRLQLSRSTDGGRTFGATEMVPGGQAAGNRGWESIAVDSAGHVFVLWLDHRETAAGMHHDAATTASPADPVAKAQLSQLVISRLGKADAQSLARGVCYCCKTSMVATGSSVMAVWRHVFPGSERDIAFAVSRDDGQTFSPPLRVSADHWQFDGCPENGPAIAVDRQQHAHVAWFTPIGSADEQQLALFYAESKDGRAFSPRVRVPTRGSAGHVQMTVAPDGAILLAWDEREDGRQQVALARGRLDSRSQSPTFQPLSVTGGLGAHPVLATTATGTVMAWVRKDEQGSTIAVARVR
ncbi:MAG: sialidase family protein [Gemmatimonadaceae bacterium]